ncbi:hypothetical protein EYF80_028728 [Liparis tanakae]|uniref:Uncharacterized protein n=1 Tax=Liparis tanakae TaxID=230148 RepID=A0A4Z2H758_9TELE|nr:hypothetical protein EYF80_028728 [Liparis tanakae]
MLPKCTLELRAMGETSLSGRELQPQYQAPRRCLSTDWIETEEEAATCCRRHHHHQHHLSSCCLCRRGTCGFCFLSLPTAATL